MIHRQMRVVRAQVVTALILCVLGLPAAAAEKATPQTAAEIQLSFAPLVKKAAPAVVNIYTRKVVRTRQVSPLFNDPFFRRFFGDSFGFRGPERRRVQNSLGSGVIVDPGGTIITNHHVVEGADEITVVLADRREFEASVVGTDEKTDLAVLKVDNGGEALPFLEFRDSDDLEVGDLVLAIGNPFGVGQTVTSGIVSALARTQIGISDLNFFIQTDAAINPGNSGGALISMDGRLVGINSAIYSKTGGSMGIGFAIPSNMVRAVLAGFAKGQGHLVRPWLGAWGQAVNSEIATSLGMARPAGVLINDVYSGGPADRAGVEVGDVILSVAGHELNDPQALRFRIATLVIGEKAELAVWRNGREVKLTLDMVPPPENPPREQTELSGRNPLSGAAVANISPALAEELGLDKVRPGVIVMGIRRGSTASRLGFRPGDAILAINGDKVTSVRDLKRILGQPAGRWRISLERDGKTLNWVIQA